MLNDNGEEEESSESSKKDNTDINKSEKELINTSNISNNTLNKKQSKIPKEFSKKKSDKIFGDSNYDIIGDNDDIDNNEQKLNTNNSNFNNNDNSSKKQFLTDNYIPGNNQENSYDFFSDEEQYKEEKEEEKEEENKNKQSKTHNESDTGPDKEDTDKNNKHNINLENSQIFQNNNDKNTSNNNNKSSINIDNGHEYNKELNNNQNPPDDNYDKNDKYNNNSSSSSLGKEEKTDNKYNKSLKKQDSSSDSDKSNSNKNDEKETSKLSNKDTSIKSEQKLKNNDNSTIIEKNKNNESVLSKKSKSDPYKNNKKLNEQNSSIIKTYKQTIIENNKYSDEEDENSSIPTKTFKKNTSINKDKSGYNNSNAEKIQGSTKKIKSKIDYESSSDSNDDNDKVQKKGSMISGNSSREKKRINTESDSSDNNPKMKEIYNYEIKNNQKSNKNFIPKKSTESNYEINYVKDEYYIKYINLKREGFQSIINRDYSSGFNIFEKCYELSQKFLKDKIRQIDSLINMSICEYYNGNFNNSLSLINMGKKIFGNVSLGECHISNRDKNNLSIKLFVNSSMANLSMNNYDASISDIKEMLQIVHTENDNHKKLRYFKKIIYMLFKVNTLLNITCENKFKKSIDYNLSRENKNNNNEQNINNNNINELYFNNNEKIMNDFLACIKNKNYNILLNSFLDNALKYKKENDLTGYYFCIFNQYIINYYKVISNNKTNSQENKKNIKDFKENLYIFNKHLIGENIMREMNHKNKELTQFLNEFNKKMECCGEIFDLLEKMEKELRNKTDDHYEQKTNNMNYLERVVTKEGETESSSYLVKLSLTYGYNNLLKKKKYLEEIQKKMDKNKNKYKKEEDEYSENEEEINEKMNNIIKLIKELELLLDKINNYEIDISSIKTQKIDRNILKNINNLFEKLRWIYYKSLLYRNFIRYKKQTQKLKLEENFKSIKNFFEDNYNKIIKGMNLVKINYGSKGYKVHFYNIDDDSSTFNTKTASTQTFPNHSYKLFKDVTKIMYGVHSNNLLKKMSDKDKDTEAIKLLKSPYNILSIMTKKRSVDLYCDDDQINNWFYGLKYFTMEKKVNYKIISTNKFILNKIKYKIVSHLKKNVANKEKEKQTYKFIKNLNKEVTLGNISFAKLILLYNKLINE